MTQDANLFGCDEPAQMRTVGCGVGAVNGDGALDPVVVGREPETVPGVDITVTEVGDLPSDLRLEEHAEACEGIAAGRGLNILPPDQFAERIATPGKPGMAICPEMAPPATR